MGLARFGQVPRVGGSFGAGSTAEETGSGPGGNNTSGSGFEVVIGLVSVWNGAFANARTEDTKPALETSVADGDSNDGLGRRFVVAMVANRDSADCDREEYGLETCDVVEEVAALFVVVVVGVVMVVKIGWVSGVKLCGGVSESIDEAFGHKSSFSASTSPDEDDSFSVTASRSFSRLPFARMVVSLSLLRLMRLICCSMAAVRCATESVASGQILVRKNLPDADESPATLGFPFWWVGIGSGLSIIRRAFGWKYFVCFQRRG